MTAVPNLVPACPKCRTPVGPDLCRPGQLTPCPNCQTDIWVEVYAALLRPIPKAVSNEAVVLSGESACFYHDAKRAVAVCDACGRFLCALCDCEISGEHICPPCLESGQKRGALNQLETQRTLWGRQAVILAVLPFLLTGLAALYLVIRHRKTPGSLVARVNWEMPVALVLALLQVLGYTVLILAFVFKG